MEKDASGLVIPETSKPLPWMDRAFVEKIIKEYTKDPKAEVHNYEINPGSNLGDKTGSVLYRCKLTFSSKFEKEKKFSMFFKCFPEANVMKNELLNATPVFDNEMQMYGETLPEIMELWKSTGDESPLHPKLIYQTKQPKTVIVLEDVVEKKFVMNNFPPPSLAESKICAKKLAKFHASTFYLANEKYVDYSNYNFSMYSDMDPVIKATMFDDCFKLFIDELKSWEGYEEYVHKFEALLKNYVSAANKTYSANPEGYNVLNHGDHHTKNLMYKKDEEGDIVDVIFLDFQTPVWASPAVDLIYSLYFDLSNENRQKYRDDYIRYYHEEFVKALKAFGYVKKPPSLLDLNIELLKHGVLEVIINVCFNVMIFIDWTKITPEDFDMGEGTRNFKKRCYQNTEYHKVIKQELPRLFYKGIL